MQRDLSSSESSNRFRHAGPRFIPRALLVVALVLGAAELPAQSPGVTDLTGQNLTKEQLVQALAPKGEKPSYPRSMTGPNCAKYRSRGFTVQEAMKEVALTVEFASDSAELTAGAKDTLDKLGAALKTDTLASCCFMVEGHTDSQNTEPYNLTLSQQRAKRVVDYLHQEFGIARDQLLDQGMGEEDPLETNDTAEGRQKNRRVEVSNLGFQTVGGGP